MTIIINGTTGVSGVDGSAGTPSLQGGDANTGFFYGTDILGFSTGGSERMRIDSSGNLGLGVTPSAWSGSYKAFQNGGASLVGTSGTSDIYLNANTYFNAGWKYIANGYATRYSQNDVSGGTHTWFTAPSGTAGDAITFTQAMTLDASGNLLVGTTTTPSGVKAAVAGSNTAVDSRGNLYVYTTNSATADYGGTLALGGCYSGTTEVPFANISGRYTGSGINGYMQFSTLSSGSIIERMRIASNGFVGVGTSNPGQNFVVYGSFPCIQITNATAGTSSGDGLLIYQNGLNGSISNQENGFLSFETNNNERMRIDSSGNLLVGTTSLISNAGKLSINFDGAALNGMSLQTTKSTTGSWFSVFQNSSGATAGTIAHNGTTTVAYNTSSDYRLKENIQPMQGALSIVQQLNPVTYTWKVDGSDGQGFIAHELQAVVPDCVTGEKDAVDAEGNPVYQGIDTSFLVATLTAAIQELNAKVESLEAQLKGAA